MVIEGGIEFAEVHITDGKTRPRTLPIIDSIPYLEDGIHYHPTDTSPDSWLFVSLANPTFVSKLTSDSLFGQYNIIIYYKIFGRSLRTKQYIRWINHLSKNY